MNMYTRLFYFVIGVMSCCATMQGQEENKQFVIETNVGTMSGILYGDVPNHVRHFTQRANRGDFNGTLFTRVIKDFMIQGGAADSKNASPGARVGAGDRTAEILPEPSLGHFHKKGALAAPRQPKDINPQLKSDMSQFFIVQGKVYRAGELDTLQRIANNPIKKKGMAIHYTPVKEMMDSLKTADPKEYNRHVVEINQRVDSLLRATPGHLLFSEEQKEALTTLGGAHHLDGQYTIFGEVTEGLEIIDLIGNQPTDKNDRPTKDIRILSITVR